jgi:glycosyltransferase involved in cell wall biosynthesis
VTSLRIAVTGLRGIPNVQGGIETHSQNLYPLIAREGHEIEVYARREFVDSASPYRWSGLRITPTWSPLHSGLEAIVHTVLTILIAAAKRPDLLHIHGIGPGLATPLARLLGIKVIVTQHGRDYERDKWGWFARTLLKLGESMSMRFAHRMICVAQNDADRLNRKYRSTKALAIPNGAPRMDEPVQPQVIDELGLTTGRYILNVARIVPEKRQMDLIQAFEQADMPGWKLVFVGSAMHPSQYDRDFHAAVEGNPDVIAAGHRSGEALATLYGGAGMFVLPSVLEGLPVSILEALSFGLPCVLSDIPANLEFELPESMYYPVGNVAALEQKLTHAASGADDKKVLARSDATRLPDRFRWESVADATLGVIKKVCAR